MYLWQSTAAKPKGGLGISIEARELLMRHDWPEMCVTGESMERAVFWAQRIQILIEDLPESVLEAAHPKRASDFS